MQPMNGALFDYRDEKKRLQPPAGQIQRPKKKKKPCTELDVSLKDVFFMSMFVSV